MKESNDLKLDVSQAHELKMAFRRNGWNNSQIKKLSEGTILRQVLQVLKGEAEINIIDYIIDCDALPFIPEGWSVAKHKPGGKIKFYAPRFILYLPEEQDGRIIKGEKLLKELEHSTNQMLNANVLDFFLIHQELIPDEWKGKYIFFWNSIYRDSLEQLVVRSLFWNNTRWDWDSACLDNNFDFDDFSLIIENQS